MVRAIRLTAEAARRLRRARGAGQVHSGFARTTNIELADAGWVSLHGPGPIPAPFGIACESAPMTAGLAGLSVLTEDNAIVLGGRLRVQLEDARLSDTALPTPTRMPPVRTCLSQALPRVTGGLLPSIAALMTEEVLPGDPLAQLAVPALAGLYAATSTRDAAACLSAARLLLGLGPGLTPAGDDCVAGWLAGAWTASRDGRRLVGRMARGLLAAAGELTGKLSCAFLSAAVAGQASEPACAFALAPTEAHLVGLLGVGETSGADFLGGYLLARAALAAVSPSSFEGEGQGEGHRTSRVRPLTLPSPPAGERRVSEARPSRD